MDWRLALAVIRGDSPRLPDFARVPDQGPRAYRDIRTRLARDQRVSAGTADRHAYRAAVRTRGARGRPVRRPQSIAPRREPGSITYYALYFPAIEILTSVALASLIVAAAARVHAHDTVGRNGRRVSAAGAPVLPAAAGSLGQVQHAAAGDGVLGADLQAPRDEPSGTRGRRPHGQCATEGQRGDTARVTDARCEPRRS